MLTTVNAILQRVPPRSFIRGALKPIAPGQRIDMGELRKRLALYGLPRTGTVMEPGEFAVRGGILDLFPPGRINPGASRFLRRHAGEHQGVRRADAAHHEAGAEARADAGSARSPSARAPTTLFRTRYVELFGGNTGDDPLYEAVSTGQRYPGQEHWLPLFHDARDAVRLRCPSAGVSFDHMADEAIAQRFEQITEHYEARVEALEGQRFGAPPYKPVPPDRMFLDGKDVGRGADRRARVTRLTPFEDADGAQRAMPCAAAAAAPSPPSAQTATPTCSTPSSRHIARLHGEHAPRHRRRLDARRARAAGDAARRSRPRRTRARSRASPRRWRCRRHARRFARARPRAGLRDAGHRRHRRAGHSRRPAGAPAPQARARPPTS